MIVTTFSLLEHIIYTWACLLCKQCWWALDKWYTQINELRRNWCYRAGTGHIRRCPVYSTLWYFFFVLICQILVEWIYSLSYHHLHIRLLSIVCLIFEFGCWNPGHRTTLNKRWYLSDSDHPSVHSHYLCEIYGMKHSVDGDMNVEIVGLWVSGWWLIDWLIDWVDLRYPAMCVFLAANIHDNLWCRYFWLGILNQ